MTIDERKDPEISDKVKAYIYTLYWNFSYPKYIWTESYFEGFIMGDYLTCQRYEMPTNKLEEGYQGVDELSKVYDICGIHKDRNDESYNILICDEVWFIDVPGNLQLIM